MYYIGYAQQKDLAVTHIEDLNVGTTVDSSTYADALFLTAGQRYTALADLCEVTVWE